MFVVTSAAQTPSLDAVAAPPEGSTQADNASIDSINDLLLNRATLNPTKTLLAYPGPDGKFIYYTARELDHFADEAAKRYVQAGLVPKGDKDESEVIAILGPSNLDYIITLFALSRIGFCVFFLSTRLSTEAYVSLLKNSDCRNIVAAPNFTSNVDAISNVYEVTQYSLLDASVYASENPVGPRFRRPVEIQDESRRLAFIVHSSGSTGLPKPIFMDHRSCLTNYSVGSGMRAFVSLPLFHNHGLSTFFRGVTSSVTTAFFDANLPLTHDNLVKFMEQFQPESFHCVPYALKLLAETDHGIEALRQCRLVLFGGSSCPDELGDKLVAAGVYVVGHYGATEMGQLMTSFRNPEDKAWNYVRPLAKTAPYLHFVPAGEGLYECVVLNGLPTKLLSNSDDPPNSYHTRDTFVPHPSITNAWKYIGRLDDRVNLVNGEKVLPIPFEHRVRQSELVEEVLVFGVGRAFPGLLIFPSAKAESFTKEQLLEKIKPLIQEANANTEKFGQVSLDMVEIMDVGITYPRTDKGTIIRAAAYKTFAKTIESIYVRFETHDASRDGDLKVLDRDGLAQYLLNLIANDIGIQGLTLDADFFEHGMDSLQAVAARAKIIREIDIGSALLSHNVVFENPSVLKLAAHLYALRSGEEIDQKDEISLMQELIKKYSGFPSFNPGTKHPDGDVIILTGATGSLGAHILSQISRLSNVKKVYCLVRAKSRDDARARVSSSLQTRKIDHPTIAEKTVALPSDFSRPDLGLDSDTFEEIRSTLTIVIHSAWMVNFNTSLSSFERTHIAGVHNFLRLCLGVPFEAPARFFFISSISAAAGTPIPATVAEAHVEELAYAQSMGYARSKLVTEHIIREASRRTGMVARVLRSGQVVGDTENGLWNPTEAIPLMFQSAMTIGALPALDETPSWLPVDKCASAIIELSGTRSSNSDIEHANPDNNTDIVYHVQNPTLFSWTNDLLPALRAGGLEFEIVPQREWVRRLRDGDQDPRRNPTIKLLDFFTEKYDNDKAGRSGLVFSTEKTARASETIGQGVDIIGSGLMNKCLESWRHIWLRE